MIWSWHAAWLSDSRITAVKIAALAVRVLQFIRFPSEEIRSNGLRAGLMLSNDWSVLNVKRRGHPTPRSSALVFATPQAALASHLADRAAAVDHRDRTALD